MSSGDAEIAAFGLSMIILFIKKRPLVFLGLFGLGGLALLIFMVVNWSGLVAGGESRKEILSKGFDAAEITFVSLTDMNDWIDDGSDLRWGIAISNEDLIQVKERNGKKYNQPVLNVEDIDHLVVASDIRTGEQINLKINPGTYDWLIIMDHDNDGLWDSYLGSIAQEIQLDNMQFFANEKYEVVVGQDSIPRLSHSTNE